MTKKKTRKKVTREAIILPWRKYAPLERLVFWYEATPQEIGLGDDIWDRIDRMVYGLLESSLGPEETATVEVGRHTLIAAVVDDTGVETRVPVWPKGAPGAEKYTQRPRKESR